MVSAIIFLTGYFGGRFFTQLRLFLKPLDFVTVLCLFFIGAKGGLGFYAEGGHFQVLQFSLFLGFVLSLAKGLIAVAVFRLLKLQVQMAIPFAIFGAVSVGTFTVALDTVSRRGFYLPSHFIPALTLMEIVTPILAVLTLFKSGGKIRLKPLIKISFLLIGFLLSYWGISEAQRVEEFARFIEWGVKKGFAYSIPILIFLLGIKTSEVKLYFTRPKLRSYLPYWLVPILNTFLSLMVCRYFQLNAVDTYLWTALTASASYIVAPAILTKMVDAKHLSEQTLYSLSIAFLFNILVNLPLLEAYLLK